MPPPELQPPNDGLQSGNPLPPVIGLPPRLPPQLAPDPGGLRAALAVLLSLCLALFLADALVSLLDDSLVLFLGIHALTALRMAVFLCAALITLLIYGLMGLTPMIPKRLFLPIPIFFVATGLAALPAALCYFSRLQQISWFISLGQVVLALGLLCWARRGLRLRWPLVANSWLGARRFSWLNLIGFLLLNILVLLPGTVVFLALSVAFAVGHSSEGFVALRPGGLTVQVRKYVRGDGKTIQLVPMLHIGEAAFYRQLSQSFPTNAVVLMEGITDNSGLITNTPSYDRMAATVGLAEQDQEFAPPQANIVMADVDTEALSTNTIYFLNLVTLIHAKGPTAENLLKIMQASPPQPEKELLAGFFDDLLRKRNEHLLSEMRSRLSDPEPIIIPWGAAHMPGIAAGVAAYGFRLAETQEYSVIRFRAAPRKR